ncbi:MAG: tagaturonate epimerase [Verrucomicrobia bacterium]|nr:MAG: tagaturonate epimerase [Verrucomicrobiota bacterium]
MLTLERFSFGVGDRFAHQAKAQLSAFQKLAHEGVLVAPVWNKSNREHTFVGSEPQSVFDAAKAAIHAQNWTHGWHVDADHIRLETVDRFIPCSDFFTLDVADSIGHPPLEKDLEAFIARHPELVGNLTIPGVGSPFKITLEDIKKVASKYLSAAQEAGQIYRHIAARKGEANFIAEVSMDETDAPQTPSELLIILAALADEKVLLQTIAPKFTGRFNKGVDYVGDLVQFEREFNDDLAVIAHAVQKYSLPANLKLSVHSGSDKFSLYPVIRRALSRTGAGLHLKTAGTTWLEELIGLSEAGGDGLALTKEIYAYALAHVDELCAPYASVIDIHHSDLPSAQTVTGWSGHQLANTIRHIPGHPDFNPNVRQLLHVSFKLAAQAGARYLDLLEANEDIVAKQVTDNIFERHMRPLFIG